MTPYFEDESATLYHGDALAIARELPSDSVDCIVTSPPYYGLRDYGIDGQYGDESSPAQYVGTMLALFSELRRVLADDGTFWLDLGDSYSGGSRTTYDIRGGNTGARGHAIARPVTGIPGKNLIGIPWQVAFALQRDGWILRSEVIWAKTNPMPESVTDRPSGSHEQLFLFVKSQRNWFDKSAVLERGDVWHVATQPFPAAHFAVMPLELAERCVMAGCKPGGTVLDPFSGSGTTGLAAARHGRRYVGIDLSREYLNLSLRTRLLQPGLFEEGA